MELNGLTLITYGQRGDAATFTLDCAWEDAAALSCPLTVTSQGATVAVYDGYEMAGIERRGAYLRVAFARKLDDSTAAAIRALEDNVGNVQAQNDETAAVLAALLGGEQ